MPTKPNKAAAATPTTDHEQEVATLWLPIGDVIPTPDNPRRKPLKIDPDIHDLSQSILELGQLVAVMVRPHPDPTRKGQYDLRAGHRRLVAVELAGLATIKAEVHDWDDAKAIEVTVVENLEREDLNPIEEARGCQMLLDRGDDMETTAARLGKTETWVRRRAGLTRLAEQWVAELDNTKSPFFEWTVGHLELIAKLPQTMQVGLLNNRQLEYASTATVSGLRRFLSNRACLLKDAVFATDLDDLVKHTGPCVTCEKRSSESPMLPGIIDDSPNSKNDECLDKDCFEKKRDAWALRELQALKKKYPDLVLVNEHYSKLAWIPKGLPVVQDHLVTTAKKADKGAVPSVKLNWAWELTKTVRYIKIRSGSGTTEKAEPKTMAQKMAGLKAKRVAKATSALHDRLQKTAGLLESFQAQHGDQAAKVMAAAVVVLGTYNNNAHAAACEYPQSGVWKDLAETQAQADDDLMFRQLQTLLCVLADRLKYYQKTKVHDNEAKRTCKLLGLDWNVYLKPAIASIKEPKSWAAEKLAEKKAKAADKKPAAKKAPAKKKPAAKTKKATKKPAKKKAPAPATA